ncbi:MULTISPECIES: 16S rRNA (guanine(527)-N(7))-methyltransferase RsmG [Saccharopolyspora]|uniref:Ribosomal RNA small subunit methyltransferase G n=1 Tax=Saccharopolyspora gregorii TaxID=33914 RepID=A0ABP6RZW3_9PSEU|nr:MULTISPECIES: 16S rRNA (guanine(527)-N(7))-methyltransferase RsmG [Saccharopolyspora]MCA1187965.1 16S rRNA (guanine(527)-N(7))-methyltransferase RsmG [Saccharopolyspora sp. 6T]MCA1191825.1 16S rRNA (guanine(527)-N(7))-methyltransferase RsmG [Saccharopolyspora sp. 6V]MCA1226034.1 16S rRNA (guanine(527)-N(7))-methyltransferase RsmG [Saccharopolyspora sp. 6M]MCA1281665.1 16S rRNA (guanine(527)-N(7))-methyltransferase RsmG [Saccharopolyspora sp. 7B]
MTAAEGDPIPVPEAARAVFGDRLPGAERFATMLAEQGVRRGLIGPRELPRIWDRHLLNSAVLAELLPPNCRVVDVGSGAGLPGIPLAIARPDVELVLLEPMARRVAWLREVIEELDLSVEVVRGRAEEGPVRDRLADQDVVTARAVAPLERLSAWCLPLLRPGGRLLALKGSTAAEELERDAAAVQAVGGSPGEVLSCGDNVLDVPTTVVVVERVSQKAPGRRRDGGRRARKDRGR